MESYNPEEDLEEDPEEECDSDLEDEQNDFDPADSDE